MKTKFWSSLLHPIGLTLTSVIVLGACSSISTDSEPIPVAITGVHHLGPDFNIGGFHVNGYSGGNIARNGGGASFVCCAALPRKWRPGLVMKVRWSVNDWSKAVRSEVDAGNYKSISFENFIATAPIEKYDEVGDLYPHFFPNGKVRLISSNYPVSNKKHPIQENDPSAVELATSGVKVIK